MEPKLYLLVLIVGMIIGFSCLQETGALIRKLQFAWPRLPSKRAEAHKS
jgi:hypothetical protein